MAHSTRPQLASAPNMAALNRVEQMTDLATVRAVARSWAPVVWQIRSLVAPSPSPAMSLLRVRHTARRASQNRSKSGPSAVISGLPAMPLASTA